MDSFESRLTAEILRSTVHINLATLLLVDPESGVLANLDGLLVGASHRYGSGMAKPPRGPYKVSFTVGAYDNTKRRKFTALALVLQVLWYFESILR